MTRRNNDTEANRIVFLGDGATWIWDRTGDIGNDNSIEVLDFYHASEHISDVCKALYGEQTQPFKQHYDKWRGLTYEGEIDPVLSELKQLRDTCEKDSLRDELQGEISYFETNHDRMRYDEYGKMGIPIGSGVVESACKHVIGKRLKLSGMTWSPAGARGMLQIRSSLKKQQIPEGFPKDTRRCCINSPNNLKALPHDAATIAEFLENDILPEVKLCSPDSEELRRLVKTRTMLVRSVVSVKNQLHGLLLSLVIEPHREQLQSKRERRRILDVVGNYQIEPGGLQFTFYRRRRSYL